MAKKKKSSGQIINRKTKDFKVNTDSTAPIKTRGNHQFNPLRPKAQPSPHDNGRPSSAGKQFTDTNRAAVGIGRPMGNFENRPLNPKNSKDAKEIRKKLDYMYTHNASGYANTNFDRTANKEQFRGNYDEIDWGKSEKRKEGKRYKKKY